MSDAFRCDFCPEGEQYHDGEPAETLYRKEHIDRQGTDHIKVADLCADCAAKVVDGGEDA